MPSRKFTLTAITSLRAPLMLRRAISSARVQGIEKDLGMSGNQFNIAISILFVSLPRHALAEDYAVTR